MGLENLNKIGAFGKLFGYVKDLFRVEVEEQIPGENSNELLEYEAQARNEVERIAKQLEKNEEFNKRIPLILRPIKDALIYGACNTPGIAERIYRMKKEKEGEPYYLLTIRPLDGPTVLLTNSEDGEDHADISLKDRVKYFFTGLLTAGTPYSIPLFQKAFNTKGSSTLYKILAATAAIAIPFLIYGFSQPNFIDGDGVKFFDELIKYKTNPFKGDTDNDGLNDGLEIFESETDPKEPNPFIAYAVERGVNPKLGKYLLELEKDGITENERELIRALAYIEHDLIPEDRKVYYMEEEILGYQKKLVSSIYDDKKISDKELKVLNKLLHEERWYVTKDVIDSGMINDKILDQDWDLDGLDNITEINQGTNPLNDLEVDPNNLSERYLVYMAGLVSTRGSPQIYGLMLEHLALKHGFKKENVISFWYYPEKYWNEFNEVLEKRKQLIAKAEYLGKEPWELLEWEVKHGLITAAKFSIYTILPWLRGHLMNDYNIEIDYLNDEVTPDRIINAIKNVPSDENDIVLLYYGGHGNSSEEFSNHFGADGIDQSTLNKAIHSIDYGRFIFISYSCDSGDYVAVKPDWRYDKGLDNNPYKLKEFLSITGTFTGNSEEITKPLLVALDNGYNLKDIFEFIYQVCRKKDIEFQEYRKREGEESEIIEWRYGGPPQLFYFDIEKRECPWLDINPIKYIPRKGKSGQ
jgi:hypothetical protein